MGRRSAVVFWTPKKKVSSKREVSKLSKLAADSGRPIKE